jgi:hypothetical protein
MLKYIGFTSVLSIFFYNTVFAQNVAGKLDRGWTWPVLPILSILKIADTNTTKMSLSNEGAIQITLDSGLATYKYIIPAQAA